MAAPIPRVPPVTRATRSSRRKWAAEGSCTRATLGNPRRGRDRSGGHLSRRRVDVATSGGETAGESGGSGAWTAQREISMNSTKAADAPDPERLVRRRRIRRDRDGRGRDPPLFRTRISSSSGPRAAPSRSSIPTARISARIWATAVASRASGCAAPSTAGPSTSRGPVARSRYAKRIPENARAKRWPTLERFGFVFVWRDPSGAAPWFELAEVPEAVEPRLVDPSAFRLDDRRPWPGARRERRRPRPFPLRPRHAQRPEHGGDGGRPLPHRLSARRDAHAARRREGRASRPAPSGWASRRPASRASARPSSSPR